MKLYYNKMTGMLGATATATTNVAKLTVKRCQDVAIELIPVDEAGQVALFPQGSTGLLVVKSEKEFTGTAKILDAVWEEPTVERRGYLFGFLAAGAGIDDELGTAPGKAGRAPSPAPAAPASSLRCAFLLHIYTLALSTGCAFMSLPNEKYCRQAFCDYCIRLI